MAGEAVRERMRVEVKRERVRRERNSQYLDKESS